MSHDLSVQGAEQFGRLARQLGEMDKRLSSNLRTQIRGVAKPLSDAVRGAAAQHSKTVAKSITLQVSPSGRGGAKVVISAKQSKMPAAKRALPALLEGSRGATFRHPVYGNRNNWVNQPAHPYLVATITPRLSTVQRAILTALDQAAAAINHNT